MLRVHAAINQMAAWNAKCQHNVLQLKIPTHSHTVPQGITRRPPNLTFVAGAADNPCGENFSNSRLSIEVGHWSRKNAHCDGKNISCGEKLSPKFCLWTKVTNMRYEGFRLAPWEINRKSYFKSGRHFITAPATKLFRKYLFCVKI